MSKVSNLIESPEWGFARPVQVHGDSQKGIPGVLPSSASTFWRKVKSGEYNELEFVRRPNLTLITVASIRRQCEILADQAQSGSEQVA